MYQLSGASTRKGELETANGLNNPAVPARNNPRKIHIRFEKGEKKKNPIEEFADGHVLALCLLEVETREQKERVDGISNTKTTNQKSM